ncbi:hypothetical protein DBR39_08910 [Chryseobacterium sp. KBW03]|uniref:DUF4843 domain-containing protein n=1 Tax=Chryseobacterium sp. KBW03 TaxID=2153362 RepID=UPI000F59629C|nr:DUF4843 domain-containing protein [Chryseobacterium sp. KBW03]RQO39100.1 hypothetical protein DBR39_08910 [Chryseobacterium sp. KBW03]
MKKIAFLILSFFVFFLNSCKDETAVYEGDSYLHFNKGTRGEAIVTEGTGSQIVDVEFGTVHPLSGSAQVKLVVDPSTSTAVEGVDFQIVNQNLTVNAGQISAKFQVKLLESGATVKPRVITFKLQSSSVANATFDQTYVLTYTKACLFTIAPFTGIYKVKVDSWKDYSVDDEVPVQQGPAANQFKILSTNNPALLNAATSYMLVTVANDGSVVVTSNQPFNYGGTDIFAVTGTGKVNFCTGDIDITSLAFGSNTGYKFSLSKN